MPYYATVSSGAFKPTSVSSAVALTRPFYGLAILVPSLSAASEVRIQFAQTSGAGTAGDVFADLQRCDGSGLAFTAYSGSGPAVAYCPMPVRHRSCG